MKQIFLKVFANGKTSTNATVLNFDRENKSGEIVIDYSDVDYLDWEKQLDLVFADGTHTFVVGNGNTLTVPLLESYLKKGSMTVQPIAKRLVVDEYEKVKWQVVALSVRDSLNVLEDDTSITPSVAEQWEIRIEAVEQAELVRQTNEGTRVTNENTRISNENTRISQESSRVNAENTRVTQENARNVFVAYNPLTPYVVGNKVSYNGSSYVCILDSLGNLPTNTTYWLLIAQKGEQGIQGDNTTATNVTNLPSGNISSTTVQGAINELDTEKADKLFATNLITNGDFSNGTTGWSGQYGTISVTSNTLSVIGNGTDPDVLGVNVTTMPATTGHKVYVRYLARVTNSVCLSLAINVRGTTSGFIYGYSVANPTINTWYNLSSVITLSGMVGNVQVRPAHRYSDMATANGKVMEVQYVQALNLTQIFGAGKEPTKEQMDWLLAQKYTNSWFDGTKELTSITDLLTLVNMKANITQEAWITPTLLNSFVDNAPLVYGTVGYRKTSINKVKIKGSVSGGANGAVAFTLPTGYRPPFQLEFITAGAGTTVSKVTILTNGEVKITTYNTVCHLISIEFDLS